MADVFGYYVNLDERGSFYADVRDIRDNTIYEVSSDDEDGTVWEVESGFMSDPHDLEGLAGYLAEMSIIAKGGEILSSDEFEVLDLDASVPASAAMQMK